MIYRTCHLAVHPVVWVAFFGGPDWVSVRTCMLFIIFLGRSVLLASRLWWRMTLEVAETVQAGAGSSAYAGSHSKGYFAHIPAVSSSW